MKLPSQSKYKSGMMRCEMDECSECDECESGNNSPCIHRRKFGEITICLWVEKETDEED